MINSLMKSEINNYIHKFIQNEKSNFVAVLFHGTGGDENSLVNLAMASLPKMNILSLRGKVKENGMNRFFRRVEEGIFDMNDLFFRTDEIYNFIKSAKETYSFNDKRLIALGYSNGANIITSILFKYPQIFAAAILLRPMLPFQPTEKINLNNKPILILSSPYDEIIPTTLTLKLINMLNSFNSYLTIQWMESGHALTYQDVKEIRAWFNALDWE